MSDTFQSLQHICQARGLRWPEGNDPFRITARLAEECGELAAAVNHRERTGIKIDKLGEPDHTHVAAEALDVMLAALCLVQHYGLEDELERRIEAVSRSYGGVSDSPS